MATRKMLLTGGTGLIGSAVVAASHKQDWEPVVLTRDAGRARHKLGGTVRCVEQLADAGMASEYAAVVNLAGATVFAPWTDARRRAIRESRVGSTNAVVQWIRETAGGSSPALISSSGIGYYGPGGDKVFTEDSPLGDDFLAEVCRDWEAAARAAEAQGARVCLLRTGLVLATEGGALASMLPAFRMGLGATLGSGKQYMPWIHLRDQTNLIYWLAEHAEARGPFNACGPHPVTNQDFTKTLAKALRRPAWFRAPSFLLNAAAGDLGKMLTTGQRALPRAALDGGYRFVFQTLPEALDDLL